MKSYNNIAIVENRRRLKRLVEFRILVGVYFDNSKANWQTDSRHESAEAVEARRKINRMLDEIHDIILCTGIVPAVVYRAAPVAGGYVNRVDLVQNIFNLHQFEIDQDPLVDFLDRSIGVYESDKTMCWIRTFNPFHYLGKILDLISALPFKLIGKIGFDETKAESSVLGKLVKGLLYLISSVAALLTILEILGFTDPVREFVNSMVGNNI